MENGTKRYFFLWKNNFEIHTYFFTLSIFFLEIYIYGLKSGNILISIWKDSQVILMVTFKNHWYKMLCTPGEVASEV